MKCRTGFPACYPLETLFLGTPHFVLEMQVSPLIHGYYKQGNTYEEAVTNLRAAMNLHIQDSLAEKESIPPSKLINLTSIVVSV